MAFQFLKKKWRTTVPISDVFFELVIERRKKCVEHGGANNPFQTSAPPAQTEDGESVSEAARSVYRLLYEVQPNKLNFPFWIWIIFNSNFC